MASRDREALARPLHLRRAAGSAAREGPEMPGAGCGRVDSPGARAHVQRSLRRQHARSTESKHVFTASPALAPQRTRLWPWIHQHVV